MAIVRYLAMTAAEFSSCEHLPANIAWLACHFSPSGRGLSNIPKTLPSHSLLIVDDSTPFENHDAGYIARQLQETVCNLNVQAVILDFQRPPALGTKQLAAILGEKLPCPVAAPPEYAQNSSAVFLPPCPLHRPLKKHIEPFRGRQIWLDTTWMPVQVTVTASGSICESLPHFPECDLPHFSPELGCAYGIEIFGDQISFTLYRNPDHAENWLQEAETLGVQAAVSLYQEVNKQKPPC